MVARGFVQMENQGFSAPLAAAIGGGIGAE
jgi:hypothetical protein